MAFQRAGFNQTREVEQKGSMITGRPDAIFLRNKYQRELDNAHSSIVNMVHYLEEKNYELKEKLNKAVSLKHDITAHEKERADLYQSLQNLLTKETHFEKEMHKMTQETRKKQPVTIKQRFKDSDVEEMRFNAMQEYVGKYPEYASKSSFNSISL